MRTLNDPSDIVARIAAEQAYAILAVANAKGAAGAIGVIERAHARVLGAYEAIVRLADQPEEIVLLNNVLSRWGRFADLLRTEQLSRPDRVVQIGKET